uniref:CPm n=1 Tax=Carnation necrotic fleck virus TaxID=551454 RepID=A0A4P2X5T1_9CLOS|nr:CPm [Carnation necrotic fleck virus]
MSDPNGEVRMTSRNSGGESNELAIVELNRDTVSTAIVPSVFDSVSHDSDSTFSKPDLEVAVVRVTEGLRTLTKAAPKDDIIHMAMLLTRVGRINTSSKSIPRGSYSYTVDGTKYTLKDSDIFSLVQRAVHQFDKSNGIRAFFASLETPYLLIAKQRPELFETRIACRRGTPKGLGYLSADFLQGSSPVLDDRERAVINRSTEHALMRASTSVGRGEIINLYDLGRF